MFSDVIISLLKKLQFVSIVILRFIKILFRWRKGIHIIYLNYDKKHLFDKSYIVINYRFRNALFYRFGNQFSLDKQIKVFDMQNIEPEFDFKVYGFFQSKTYHIKLNPQLILETSTFATHINNLTVQLQVNKIPKLSPSPIFFVFEKPIVTAPKIKLKQRSTIFKKPTFNQTDFI